MTLLALMGRKRSSATALGIVLLSSIGLLGTPCAMAFAMDTPTTQSTDSAKTSGAHDDCPNSRPDKPMSPSDCCCDLADVLGFKSPETPELFAVQALSIEDGSHMLIVADSLTIDNRTVLYGASSPIYLVTQRLRI